MLTQMNLYLLTVSSGNLSCYSLLLSSTVHTTCLPEPIKAFPFSPELHGRIKVPGSSIDCVDDTRLDSRGHGTGLRGRHSRNSGVVRRWAMRTETLWETQEAPSTAEVSNQRTSSTEMNKSCALTGTAQGILPHTSHTG